MSDSIPRIYLVYTRLVLDSLSPPESHTHTVRSRQTGHPPTPTQSHPPLPHSGERQISVVFFSLPIQVRRSGAHQNVEEGTLFHITEIWVACPPHTSTRKQRFGRPLSIGQSTFSHPLPCLIEGHSPHWCEEDCPKVESP
jgi:hypothetical protein